MLRSTTVLALASAAAAFSPMMSMETGRRQVVQAGAAAAVAAPLLRANPASAGSGGGNQFGKMDKSQTASGFATVSGMDKSARAPAILILDHRGCTAHENKEYTGEKASSQDDEMCVVVRSNRVT